MRGIRRHAYWAVCATILAVALLIRIADPVIVQSLRLIVFDTFQRLAPRDFDPNLPVRIVDIDEASLAQIGQWPWPRTTMRDLVVKLGDAGASAIAFDVLFAEPDRSSLEQIVKHLPPEQAQAIGAAASMAPSNDAAFAEAIARYPVVTATTLSMGATGEARREGGLRCGGRRSATVHRRVHWRHPQPAGHRQCGDRDRLDQLGSGSRSDRS